MSETTEKKRSALLTIWLIWMLLANILTALTYLLGRELITKLLTTVPLWAIYALGFLALLNVVFTIFLFRWKRWAFYGFCANAGIAFVINLTIGTEFVWALVGLAGPVILYLLMRPQWELFE